MNFLLSNSDSRFLTITETPVSSIYIRYMRRYCLLYLIYIELTKLFKITSDLQKILYSRIINSLSTNNQSEVILDDTLMEYSK